MDYTEYFILRDLVARINALPGRLEPMEVKILNAVELALTVFNEKIELGKKVKAILNGLVKSQNSMAK